VRRTVSRPRLPLDPDLAMFAPETKPKLNMSLSLPFVPLRVGSNGANALRCTFSDVSTVEGLLRALVGMVNEGRVPKSSLGVCMMGISVALVK
jgi:hypothetical protein